MNLSIMANKQYLYSGIMIVLYSVGIYAFATEWQTVINLTPMQLILSTVILFLAHIRIDSDLIKFSITAYLISFIAECIGVNTGFPFGQYTYHEVLGYKILETPLLIGINWLMLLLASRSVVERFFGNKSILLQIFLDALIMVGLDFLIEPIAIHYKFWTWADSYIPWNNYVSWFILAFGLHYLQRKMLPVYSNLSADVLLLLQVLFFGTLNLILLNY
jgi:putative membrane protein